jgi:hypothetical protein
VPQRPQLIAEQRMRARRLGGNLQNVNENAVALFNNIKR